MNVYTHVIGPDMMKRMSYNYDILELNSKYKYYDYVMLDFITV